MGWFYLSWIVIAPVAFVYVSCQELITSLPEDSDACLRNEVTFTCTIRGSSNLTSSIIAWRSSEYIGKGDALQFTSEDMAGTNRTSMINGNVTAILTNNTGIGGAVRVPVLVSKLRIVNADQNSMITCNSLTSGSSASTEFDGSAFPGSPQNILAREISAGSCEILVTWDPPTNIDRSDIDHYMVYVPSRNIMEIEFSTTTILVVPNCRSDDTLSIQVAAMNRFGCVGPNSSPTQLRLMEIPTTPTSVNTVSPGVIAGVIAGVTICIILVILVIPAIFCSIHIRKVFLQTFKKDQEDFQRTLEHLLVALKFNSSQAIKEAARHLSQIMKKKTPSTYIKEGLVRALDKIKWEKHGQYVQTALYSLQNMIKDTMQTFDKELKAVTPIDETWKDITMAKLIHKEGSGQHQQVFDFLIQTVDNTAPKKVKELLKEMCDKLQVYEPNANETNVDETLSGETWTDEHQEAFGEMIEKLPPEKAKELLTQFLGKLQEVVGRDASASASASNHKAHTYFYQSMALHETQV